MSFKCINCVWKGEKKELAQVPVKDTCPVCGDDGEKIKIGPVEENKNEPENVEGQSEEHVRDGGDIDGSGSEVSKVEEEKPAENKKELTPEEQSKGK